MPALPPYFNPRSPHGERLKMTFAAVCLVLFQPTLPARGATRPLRWRWASAPYFNPRSPHGERLSMDTKLPMASQFQPTLPARGATAGQLGIATENIISTHAPRTGSDVRIGSLLPGLKNFNPRSPHGERPNFGAKAAGSAAFQPTLPARGATRTTRVWKPRRRISTHAPRTGSDCAK